jgi:glutathione S-transferase
MRYLAKVFPDKAGKFIPADPVLAAKIDMVANYEPHVYSFIAKSAYPSLGFPLYAGDVATMDSTKENVAEAAAAAGSELLNIYENKFVNIFLKDTKFLLSDELTIADFRHAPVMLFAKIGCVLPARLEQYLKDVEAAAPGYAEAVAGTTGFASPHWKK